MRHLRQLRLQRQATHLPEEVQGSANAEGQERLAGQCSLWPEQKTTHTLGRSGVGSMTVGVLRAMCMFVT